MDRLHRIIAPTLLIGIFFLVSGCTAREDNSRDSKPKAIYNSQASGSAGASTPTHDPGHPGHDDAREALERANSATLDENWGLAYDYLLAAMVRDSSDPRVFETVCNFAEQAVQVSNAADYALDLVQRADLMVPYLPVSDIAAARTRISAILLALTPEPVTLPRPADVLLDRLASLQAGSLSPSLKLQGALQLQRQLDDAQVQAALDGDPDRLTNEELKKVTAALDKAQRSILAENYRATRERYINWANNKAGKLINEVNGGVLKYSRRMEIDVEFLDVIRAGGLLMSEVAPFADSDVSLSVGGNEKSAKEDLDTLQQIVTRCQRSREWNYNVTAFDYIKTQRDADGPEYDRCKFLVQYTDESRLYPYIAEQRREVFKVLFGKLDDEQRTAITKYQIMKEMAE